MAFDAGSIVGKLELAIDGWKQSVEKVKEDQTSLTGFALRHKEEIQDLGKKFAATGAAITGALSAIVLKTVDVEHEFGEMSKKTGISTEDLSSLSLAANKSGMDIEGVVRGMKFLAAQMLETAKATEGQTTILGALGIKATDTQGNMRGMNSVLFDVADKFAGMSDGAIKARLAVQIFGRAGLEMIPMLNMGSKGLQENADLAEKFGIVVSKDAATGADKFKDSMKDMEAASAGLGRVIGEAVMPMMKTIVQGMTDAAVAARNWAKENPELSQALAAVGLAAGGVLTLAGGLMLTIPKLIESFRGFAAVLKITTAELALSLAGLTLLVGAAVYAYGAFTQLTAAKTAANEADYTAFQRNEELGKKLRQVADAAGMTRAAFVELTEKYRGNYAAMAMAIKHGQEGVTLQTQLAKTGKELAAAHDLAGNAAKDQDEKMRKLLDSLNGTTGGAKTLKDELGLLFTADLAAKIGKIEEALVKYKGQLAPDSEQKLREELTKLSNEYGIATGKLQPLKQTHMDLSEILKRAPGEFQGAQAWSDRYNDELKEMGALTIPQIKEATRHYIEQQQILTELWHTGQMTGEEYRIKMDEIQKKIRELGTDGTDTGKKLTDGAATAKNGWSDFFSSVTSKWSDVIKGFITGETSIVTTWNRMWKAMWQTVYDVLAKQIAEALVNFIEKQFIPTIGKATDAISGVGTAASNIGTAVSGVFASIGTIITTLATAVATAITTIGTAIGTALVTLAASIATAATTLAAAAPALLVVGGIALALYAGFSLIGSLFGGGGGGSGSDSDQSHWLKLIHNLTKESHDWIMGIWQHLLSEAWACAQMTRDFTNQTQDLLRSNIDPLLRGAIDELRAIKEGIASLPHGARGLVVNEPTLAFIGENAPAIPEIVAPLPYIQGIVSQAAIGGSGGRSININAAFNINAVDGMSVRDLVRSKIGPEFVQWIKTNVGKQQMREALGIGG